jgi:hypothetical protein
MNFDNLEYEKVTDEKVEFLLSLVNTSSYSNEQKDIYISELETFDITPERYEELSKQIFNNQLDRINAGLNYSASDINRKIKKEIL